VTLNSCEGQVDRERSIERFLPLRPVEFNILLSLAAGERHGYGIILDAEARDLGAVPDVGTLYRALRRLEDQKLIGARERTTRNESVMNARERLSQSERWFRLLLRCYPVDFRDEMGASLVETYLDRCRTVAAQHKSVGNRRRLGQRTRRLRSQWNRRATAAGCALASIRKLGQGHRARGAAPQARAGVFARDARHARRRPRRLRGRPTVI